MTDRRTLTDLLGHRVLILDHQELVEALEVAVGASVRRRAMGEREYDETRHSRLCEALRQMREMERQ